MRAVLCGIGRRPARATRPWLVSALAVIGEQQQARDLMERLLRVASPLGYAEEFDVSTGRHLGNFPQAFSHLALIEAAARIIAAERRAEI
jgi:alpha,alpha-trehalase